MQRPNLKHGVSLAEAIIGISIIALSLLGSISTFLFIVKSNQNSVTSVQTSYLLSEGFEALTHLRNDTWHYNFDFMPRDTKYYVNFAGTKWATTTTPSMIDGIYDRYFKISAVYRDGSGNIANSGTPDTGSIKVTVYVDYWNNNATTSISYVNYLFNIYNN
jgi:Tfp pilus assembly protein PilV